MKVKDLKRMDRCKKRFYLKLQMRSFANKYAKSKR